MERRRVPVLTGYAKWADSYDAYANPLIAVEEPIVRRLVGEPRGLSVLDAACGTGRHAAWLAAAGARVTGVDPSEEMLAVARTKCPRVDLRAGSLAHLGVPDASFDVAVCALVFEHLPELERAFDELARVVRPGGALVASVYHPVFMLKGIPPHFLHEADGVEYEMDGHPHLIADYFAELRRVGLTLTDLLEPIVDEALMTQYPRMRKHAGLPVGVIFRAVRPG
jgi:ubiquinone/menaquinone biosynthesis C-methylase UbiE